MNHFKSSLVVFAVLVLWAENAYAYLDPATGSLFLQAVVAAIAGVALVLRTYWDRFKGFFARILSRSAEAPESID